jgi:hypothetical protein
MKNVKRFISEINRVYTTNLTKVRVGGQGDGGYVTLDQLNEKTSMMYSAGVGDDVSFELDFKQQHPNVWFKLFDPTIESAPVLNDSIFSKTELRLGEIEGRNNLLKMDIEYDEWQTLMEMPERTIKQFSQIVMEIHLVHIAPSQGRSPYFTGMYNKAYDRMNNILFGYYADVLHWLNEMFYIHHIHPNNSLPKINLGGFSFPPLMEVSFVRKELVNTCNGVPSYPTELDVPNKSDRPDIENFYPIGNLC